MKVHILLSSIISKLYNYLKELLNPSIRDYYSTINFLKFRFKINRKKIRQFKNIHLNKTIFLVGAGPSLNNEKIELLKDHIVISYNFSYQIFKNFRPKYFYSVIHGARINVADNVNRSLFDASFRFPGAKDDELIKDSAIKKNDIILPTTYKFYLYKIKDGNAGFSNDIAKNIKNSGGGTGLLSCVQIAKYMGANKIVLLGADFGVFDKKKNHFSESNFKDTTSWVNKLDEYYKMKEKSLHKALKTIKFICNKNDIKIINASSQTKDIVLDKEKLENI